MKNRKRSLEVYQGCFFKKEIRLLMAFIFFLAFSTTTVFAQQTVIGVVSDSSDGSAIPGVSVVIKGTTVGTITDIDGKYSISAEKDQVLVFSFIGYTTQEIEVGDNVSIDIKLRASLESLDEVVVVGYGTTKRSDLTGAVTSINVESLQAEVVNSLDQAIQGKAAGVQVTQNSGSPSAATSIRIRGANSLRSNEPLYVIDGVPVNSDATGTTTGFDWAGGGNGQTAVNVLLTINPADIVSIEILKDASSTAIYGSRGANGVVLVTTKKGQKGEAVIAYSFNYGVQTPAKYLDVMNLKEYAEYQNDIAEQLDFITPRPEFADLNLVPKDGTNWQKELFRDALISEHNLSISGGNDNTVYSISGGYKDQEGMILGSDFKRYSGRINVSTQAKEWLNVGMNISASKSEETINLTDSDDGVITNALIISPYQQVRDISGEWAGPDNDDMASGTNPVAKATEISNNLVRTRILGNIYADIKLMPSLTLRSEFGTDIGFNNNYGFQPSYDWGRNSKNEIAKSNRKFANNTYWIQKNYLTFDKQFDEHSLKVMVGQESQKYRYESLTGERHDFVSNDIQELSAGGTDIQLATSSAGSGTMASVFSRLNYSYKGKYLFTGTYRADGSSKFGPNNKWGYFPSFSLAWRAGEEGFFDGFDWLSNLKLRAGWGQVGNDGIGNYSYGSSLQVRATAYGGGFLVNNIPNPNVKWEATTQTNIGIDLGLFNNRIELIAEYYNKFTKDMLIVLPVPDYLGTLQGIGQGWQGIQPPSSNVGEMENKGFEFTLNTVNIASKNFNWNTSITFSRNKNKVTSMGIPFAQISKKVQWYDFVTRTTEGYPVGQFYGYVVDGIFQSVDEVNTSPSQGSSVNKLSGTWEGDIKFKDLNDDGKIDDNDRTFIGDPNPDFTFGITNNFTYKNFDLNVYMNGSYGNDIFNFQRIKTEAMSDLFHNQAKSVTNRWTPENTNTDMPRYANTDPNQNTRISDRYVEDGSFLRISNVTLGYSLPKIILDKTPIESVRLYTKVQNVYTFTNYSGYDPEVGAYNQDALLNGVDNGRYPLPRTFLFGLNITF